MRGLLDFGASDGGYSLPSWCEARFFLIAQSENSTKRICPPWSLAEGGVSADTKGRTEGEAENALVDFVEGGRRIRNMHAH